ncbi:MAG: hypothetical protein ACM3VV_04385 [Deltaproteobacteria bacterium]
MIKEKYIILTIPLIFSAILLVTSTITASASINNYFKDKDGDDYENKFYREKYKEKIYRQDALCDDPQAVKKYGEICKGHGNSFEDVKEECKDKGGEWNNGKCKFEDDDEDEKDFEDEFEEEEEDKEDD